MMIHLSWLWLEESELAYAVGRAVESPPYFWPAFVSCFAWGSGELRLEPNFQTNQAYSRMFPPTDD